MNQIKETLKQNLLSTNYFINNEYFKKYVDLVCDNINTQKSAITQKHHIIPRHHYFHNNLDINNDITNLVNLSFSQHILAHYYLSLCSANLSDKYSNESALFRMCGEHHIDISNLEKYNEVYQNFIEHDRQLHLGTHHETSQDTKDKISISNKGNGLGDIHIYSGDVEKHVKPDDLLIYLDNGWNIGRSEKTRKALSNSYNYESKGMQGKSQTDYQKKCVSDKLSGVPKSDSAKDNMRKARIGKILVSNDITGKSFYTNIENLDTLLNNGFHRGRLNK